jgi:GTPase involved in cell partitioning and DNA repair
MKLGIIGLPQSGKTTIFNALTRGNTPTTASAGRIEVHNAVVEVPDPRVTKLSAMFNPKKTIYAKVTYADIAGLETGSAKSGISGQLLHSRCACLRKRFGHASLRQCGCEARRRVHAERVVAQ